MNPCKQAALDELEKAVLVLRRGLEEKLKEKKQVTADVQSRAAPKELDYNHVFFMEGEVLVMGAMNRDAVIGAMTNLGMPQDAYQLVVEGGPLYFCDSEQHPDHEVSEIRYLTQGDLPYGFVGTAEEPGVFQFSSPEIANLTLSAGPLELDDAYIYYGKSTTSPTQVTYEKMKAADGAKTYRQNANHFAWFPASNKSEAQSNVANGNVAQITYRTSAGLERRLYSTTEDLTALANKLGSTDKMNVEWGNFYSPGRYIGWRISIATTTYGNKIEARLLQMPKGQLAEFDVNPNPQEPYRGAEGVYPVILVEILRDVNIYF